MTYTELVQKRTDQLETGDVVRVVRDFTAWLEDDDKARAYSSPASAVSWGVVEQIYNIADMDEVPNAPDFASGGATQISLNALHRRPEMRLVQVDWPEQITHSYYGDRYIVASVHDLWTVQQTKEN